MANANDRMMCIAIRMELLRVALAHGNGRMSLSEVLEDAGRLEDFVFGERPHDTEGALVNLVQLQVRGKA